MKRRAHLVEWLRTKDRDFVALRRAARAAIVMPLLFAIGAKIVENAAFATFAAFGSFAMLLLVDFSGTIRERLESQLALGIVGAGLVALGTSASQHAWTAALAMAAVGFCVLFSGVVSSVLASAASSLLLAFILPAATKAPLSSIPAEMAGWGVAAAASLFAIAVLWPAPAHDPIRKQASAACRALAKRLRAAVIYHRQLGPADRDAYLQALVDANAAVAALHTTFLLTPYRPTGLSTPARAIIRLIDELSWVNTTVVKSSPEAAQAPARPSVLAVKTAAADVLAQASALLDGSSSDLDLLNSHLAEMRSSLANLEREATTVLPVRSQRSDQDEVVEIVSSLDPAFRAQELGFAVGQIGSNVALALTAERRSWIERLLGRQPDGAASTLTAARDRAGAHLERHSAWLRNSIRGAVALGAAIYVANVSGVQHSFWVVLGTLSVLRSSVLNTGQNLLRGLAGTAAGFAIGGVLLWGIGSNTAALWIALPFAILLAGVAPAAISFAAGQAAFTVTLLVLFNIIAPVGWRVGLIRIEDVAIGGLVSLVVGVLFWPRGAAAALGIALAEAYADSAAYLDSAVRYGISRCARQDGLRPLPPPDEEAALAAAASRRLDDTFRTYLAERGAKPVPMAEITNLLTGVMGLRLAASAVSELWERDDAPEPGDRDAARRELLGAASTIHDWFDVFAAGLTGTTDLPAPDSRDDGADGRLINAVRTDLSCDDGSASATAVRVIWTGDHLDAVRLLERTIIEPARAVRT